MKLKMIVAAVGLILSAASQAAIVPVSTTGGSSLLLNVWEQGAAGGQPDQSFTLNLNMTFTQFVNASNSSATLATLLSTDTTWTNFLASSDTTDIGALQWSVIAAGAKVPTSRPAIFATATVGTDPTALGMTNADIGGSTVQLSSTIGNLKGDETVNLPGTNSYYQDFGLSTFNGLAWSNGNNIGDSAAVWTASSISGGGTVAAGLTQLSGSMSLAQVGGNYVLSYNVAAVPEAPGIGMAAAGLAALGFLALRRRSA